VVSAKDGGDNQPAQELLNKLATHLTAANITNVQLSAHLKALSDTLLAENAFEERKGRYKLVDTGNGEMIMVLRSEAANGDPVHYICPICLERDRRFHFVTGPADKDGKICQGCRHFFRFYPHNPSYRGGRIIGG
jgi:hypothetical protein